jgi:hypothetical protein
MIVRYLLAWLLKLVPELKWSNERLIRKKSSELTVTARSPLVGFYARDNRLAQPGIAQAGIRARF